MGSRGQGSVREETSQEVTSFIPHAVLALERSERGRIDLLERLALPQNLWVERRGAGSAPARQEGRSEFTPKKGSFPGLNFKYDVTDKSPE